MDDIIVVCAIARSAVDEEMSARFLVIYDAFLIFRVPERFQ